ncbi:hypothetical protein MNB_SV-15-1149 [hydrothermal vent metagenome]|uniref:Uncharacterized protein n=1 Tax=hydrothermal vent metagenome TaxID=652676 RepID=A0A1W1EL19_9ZZZZ
MVTKEDLAQAILEIKELQKDTAQRFQETDTRFQETDTRFKETSEQFKETDKEFQKTKELIEQNYIKSQKSMEELKTFSKNLSINIDGISRTQGEITEDYFYNILNRDKSVAGLKFDNIERILYQYARHDLKGEYDIIMFNGNSVLIVEIKNKIRNKDIDNLKTKQIANFRELFQTIKILKYMEQWQDLLSKMSW